MFTQLSECSNDITKKSIISMISFDFLDLRIIWFYSKKWLIGYPVVVEC